LAPDYPGEPVPEGKTNLHLAPDRQPRQHPTTQFFTGWMPFLPPNQHGQSTESKEAPVNAKDNFLYSLLLQ